MDITTRQINEMQLAAFVTRAPNINFGGAWQSLHPAVRQQDLVKPGALFLSTFSASALDGPQSMSWYAAAMTLQGGENVAAPLELQNVPSGNYAVALHVGPYELMAKAWGDAVGGIRAAKYELDLTRPCLEIYLNNPGSTEPSDLRTELCVPIK